MLHRLIGGLLLAASLAAAQALPSETDRLAATARLWVTVNYFHPYLAYRDLDWDQALVAALPKIRTAKSQAEYEAAVREMLLGIADNQPGQRIWVHHGLPPETGQPDNQFYSAFLNTSSSAPPEVSVPMGGFNVALQLSEAATAPASPSPRVAKRYNDPYPSTELRILAAFKIWGVFHYFFAYRDLMDEDWDALLPQFLPRLIAAKDALEYNLAIAEWLTHTADSFSIPNSQTLSAYFGAAPVGLTLRIVDKHAVITQVLDPAATQAGVKVGDIVKKVDGETLVDRFKRLAQYTPASTLQALAVDVTNRILNGPEGSAALLTLEDPAGNRKELTLNRRQFRPESTSEAVKTLRGGIGYADLRILKRDEVDAMFDKFRQAPAIVFDMRGVPSEDAFALVAPRLTPESDAPAEIVTGPLAMAPDLTQASVSSPSSSYFFVRTLGASSQWKYKGKTIMLVDERTIGIGERAGLYLEAANKTEFIGTPTAGAHSAVSNFVVPGGITISFSGIDIRHANSGKLQRLGLQPSVTVAPTLNGIRTGRDEVLERALEQLLSQRIVPRKEGLL